LKAQLLGNFSGAALDPERVQPGGRGAVDVPGICRNESEFGIRHLHPLGSKILDARADLENLDFLDADDVVEKITNPRALRRRLQHLGLAVGQDRKLDPLLLQRLKAGLHVWESGKAQVGSAAK
jgi:hypothetical protein